MLTAVAQVVMGCVVGQHLVWVSEPFTALSRHAALVGARSPGPPRPTRGHLMMQMIGTTRR
jgi:hypothetical protein